MAFFKRELSPVERFEAALKEKQAVRRKLADRLGLTEAALAEQRAAAERLAVAGAAHAKLDRAEAGMREVEERAKALRAELAECEEQIDAMHRARARRGEGAARPRPGGGRDRGHGGGDRGGRPQLQFRAASLVEAVATSPASVPEAADGAFRECRRHAPGGLVRGGADLLELRSAAVRTRAGNL